MATTITTELETRNVAMNAANDIELIFTKPFFDNEEYINAMVNSIKPFVENQSFDKIIFSYHGIPKRQAKKTDEQVSIVFQFPIVVKLKTKVLKTAIGLILE